MIGAIDHSRNLLKAFSGEWQRLGDVAPHVKHRGKPKLITLARKLRDEGLLESRYHRAYYEWRLTASGTEAEDKKHDD